jgi:hypothetical protein
MPGQYDYHIKAAGMLTDANNETIKRGFFSLCLSHALSRNQS